MGLGWPTAIQDLTMDALAHEDGQSMGLPCIDGGFRHLFIRDGIACQRCHVSRDQCAFPATASKRPNAPSHEAQNSPAIDNEIWTVVADEQGYMELVLLPLSRHEKPIHRKYAVLMQRDGDQCHFCRERIPLAQCTVDHLVPRSRGGSSDQRNLVLSCRRCNQFKGNMTETEFWTWIVRMAHVHKNG